MSQWEHVSVNANLGKGPAPRPDLLRDAARLHPFKDRDPLSIQSPQERFQAHSSRIKFKAKGAPNSYQSGARAKQNAYGIARGNGAKTSDRHPVRARQHRSFHEGSSASCGRPPLTQIPENRPLPTTINHPKVLERGPRLELPLPRIPHTTTTPHTNGSSPRKLLWPRETSRLVLSESSGASQRQTGGYRSSSSRGLKHAKRRQLPDLNAFRRTPPRLYHRPPTAQLKRISERVKLSYAEQRYCPRGPSQAEKLRNSVQTRFKMSTALNTAHNTTHPNLSPPFDERRSNLVEHLVQKLPESPPTLHLHSSPQPPNPGSPRKMSPTTASRVSKKQTGRSPSLLVPEDLQHDPPPSMRKMLRWEIWLYRIFFGTVIVVLNISILVVYLLTPRHHYLLAFLVFMKSKDLLSTVAGIFGSLRSTLYDWLWPPGDVDSKWIMSIVCAYAETESQIVKTTQTLVDQELIQHKQVICIILDGKPRNVLSHFTQITHHMERPYPTWKGVENNLQVHAGFIKDAPTILIQKERNAGKKDTLILGHGLFNYPRDDASTHMKLLRRDIFAHILPDLTGVEGFKAFDYVYATDADSTIHNDCLKELANALSRNSKAIAACGIILAELDGPHEWSAWHLFQQFQYTFGQYVRRQAESVWGRVTCLPGPVTMIAVRPEMGAAISEYAAPVTSPNLFLHQVQYQGTDRRLTWCMLAQGKHLQTILVTKAIGETVVPSSLDHYLSQRRRWAANAYFNDYMYAFGKEQRLVTRIFGIIDIVRMSFVYYRVMNTALFIRSLIRVFYMLKIIPTLIMTKSPTTWFLLLMVLREPVLRKRLHKLVCGIALNQVMSPILSVIVFSRVLVNMGNHAWGKTGVSSNNVSAVSAVYVAPSTPRSPWSPRKLVSIIKMAIQHSEPELQGQKTLIEGNVFKTRREVHITTINTSTINTTEYLRDPEKKTAVNMPQTPSEIAQRSTVTPTRSVHDIVASPNSTVRKRIWHGNFSTTYQNSSPTLRSTATSLRGI